MIKVIQQHADITMCFLWLVTYILVIISTIKSKFPAMSPIACIIIFPWELLAAIGSISAFNALSYVHVGHIGFAILDLLIILVVIFKLRYFDIHNTVCYIYILFVNILVTLLMWRLPNGVLYSSYINTFLGTVFWILHILRDCYPTTRINIFLSVSKFIADSIAFVTYHTSDIQVFIMSLLLPIAEALQIILLIRKKRK